MGRCQKKGYLLGIPSALVEGITKLVLVCGGNPNRSLYGPFISIKWSDQRRCKGLIADLQIFVSLGIFPRVGKYYSGVQF